MIDYSGQTVRHYVIERKIADSFHGAVYRGNNQDTQEAVAIKMLSIQGLEDEKAIKRFQMEAVISFRLKHPYIVPLRDYWSDDNGIWLVTQWMQSGNLRDHMPMSAPDMLNMLERLSQALSKAHRLNVVHRDIKPDNILFDQENQAYLTDFGIAKRTKAADLTAADATIGSPAYYSPEQIRKLPITPQTDIYALGVVMFEALAGIHPFGNIASSMQVILKHLTDPLPTIHIYREDLPQALDEVFQKATAKDSSQRHETVIDLLADFRRVLE